jgi:hypothetical protein
MPSEFCEYMQKIHDKHDYRTRHQLDRDFFREARPCYEAILASEQVAKVAKKAYALPDDQNRAIVQTLARQAVTLPQQWKYRDTRPLADRIKPVEHFEEALKRLEQIMNDSLNALCLPMKPNQSTSGF